MTIILYSSDTCGKCKVLKTKLNNKGIKFETVTDVETMMKKNIDFLPVLEVDGKMMQFEEANEWVNKKGE